MGMKTKYLGEENTQLEMKFKDLGEGKYQNGDERQRLERGKHQTGDEIESLGEPWIQGNYILLWTQLKFFSLSGYWPRHEIIILSQADNNTCGTKARQQSTTRGGIYDVVAKLAKGNILYHTQTDNHYFFVEQLLIQNKEISIFYKFNFLKFQHLMNMYLKYTMCCVIVIITTIVGIGV